MADDDIKRARLERLRRAKELREQQQKSASIRQEDTLADTQPDLSSPPLDQSTSTHQINAIPLAKPEKISIKFAAPVSQKQPSRSRRVRSEFSDIDASSESQRDIESSKRNFKNFDEPRIAVSLGENVDFEDPLDQYMKQVEQEVVEISQQSLADSRTYDDKQKLENDLQDSDKQEDDEDPTEMPNSDNLTEEDILALAAKRAKKKDLQLIDHSKIDYEPFRKDFYVEAADIARMTEEEVAYSRSLLDNIRIRGINCPKPIKRWSQCGLPLQCERIIKQLGFESPTPIQAQAIPAIMSGRDVIGIAKTGSGKTMAFLLPMFRHVKDQRPVNVHDGPVALIMIPTRELAIQIYTECKRFCTGLSLRVACAYGGAPIKDQIAELKRGVEILVCTPGRLIDLLCANNGRVTNLQRVTYLVLDESDRLFDFGFEQQITRIIANIRPDSQRLLFSATFPKPVEALARRILKKPLEIMVGQRSVVCADVKQIVEVIEEDQKFVRLLELLGQWHDENTNQRILIFVDRQESADNLLKELFRRGYRCLSLHGGKDQMDRDSTIFDFKSGACDMLIATSVAARGLDVPELNLVINYECPNHKEDYVHRVGRTGRAGRKGTAFTFITRNDDKFAPGIMSSLTESNVEIPTALKTMVEEFMEKVKSGEEHLPSTGFGGKGLERIEKERENIRKAQKRSYGDEEYMSEEEDLVKDEEPLDDQKPSARTTVPVNLPASALTALSKAQEVAARVNLAAAISGTKKDTFDALEQINAQFKDSAYAATIQEPKAFSVEIEINNYPQKARWKVNSGDFKNALSEITKCSITTRGTYFPPGKIPKGDERSLHIIIEGTSKLDVERARLEIMRTLSEATSEAIESERTGSSKYSVV